MEITNCIDSKKLLKLRLKRNLTQRAVSDRTFLSNVSIHHLEKGNRKTPRIDTVLELMRFYKVDLKDIITDEAIKKYLK